MGTVRIYDNPKHPQYAPVRRMWVILAQLNLLEFADTCGPVNVPWDAHLAGSLAKHPHQRESEHQEALLYMILSGYREHVVNSPRDRLQ